MCDLWGFVVLKFCALEFGYKGSRDEKMPKQKKKKKKESLVVYNHSLF